MALSEAGATTGPGVLATFSYDDLGMRTSLARGNGTTTNYTYDAVSQLSTLTQDVAGVGSDLTLGFGHNPVGQITTATRSNDAYAWTGHYDRDTLYGINGLNQATSAGNAAIGHDARGNTTSVGAAGYTYSAENLLLTGPSSASLIYDPLARLYQVGQSATTRFLYDGQEMVGEYDGSDMLRRRYVFGPGSDEALVWYEGAGTGDRRWLHADERGSVIAVSDGAGTTLATNAYDEYGAPALNNLGRFGYTGQAWLPELGLWYYKARVYAPRLGRFMQADPFGYGDGLNGYAYVGGDPVNKIDATGLWHQEYRVMEYWSDDGHGGWQGTGVGYYVWLPDPEDFNSPGSGVGGGSFGGGSFGGGGGSGGGQPAPMPAPVTQNGNRTTTICERRDWHNLKVSEKVGALRAAGYSVAVNVRIARFPSFAPSYAVADYIALAPGSTPNNRIWYLGEVKTGDADLTPNQHVNYYSGLTQIRSSNASNIFLDKGDVIPVIWNGVDRFPGCPSR